MHWYYFLPIPVVAVVWMAWRPFRLFGREVQFERARELYKLQRERLQEIFFRAAAESGKPRGLRWSNIDWEEQVVFAREKQRGQLAALVAVTIQFEAVEGSDMEDLPAVGNLRNASAVFFFQKGQWHTVGKVLFNFNPDEAITHFENLYERVGHL
ncbi:MAG: hypothetical protein AB7K24_04365 [Gemmataceae bacterium]